MYVNKVDQRFKILKIFKNKKRVKRSQLEHEELKILEKYFIGRTVRPQLLKKDSTKT